MENSVYSSGNATALNRSHAGQAVGIASIAQFITDGLLSITNSMPVILQ